jgi:hypothetical protein
MIRENLAIMHQASSIWPGLCVAGHRLMHQGHNPTSWRCSSTRALQQQLAFCSIHESCVHHGHQAGLPIAAAAAVAAAVAAAAVVVFDDL